jgi:hypothetical protein
MMRSRSMRLFGSEYQFTTPLLKIGQLTWQIDRTNHMLTTLKGAGG